MTKKQLTDYITNLTRYVAQMPLDELRWAALMYDGQPVEGKLTDEQQTILKLAHARAVKMPELWK